MDINENVVFNISNILRNDCNDKSINLKILNIFFDNEIDFNELREEYKNIEFLNLKLENSNTEDIDIYKNEKFDYIIVIETLEKLINPETFIKNIKHYLKPEGTIICNILNVMHSSVLKSILYGKFTYSDAGILNKSNLRFFTLEEINRLFIREGYNLKQTLGILTDCSEDENKLMDSFCGLINKDLKVHYSSYSYIIALTLRIPKTLSDYVFDN